MAPHRVPAYVRLSQALSWFIKMAPKGGAVFFTCLVLLANAASACIFIFGDAPNATGARPSMLVSPHSVCICTRSPLNSGTRL